MVETCSAVLGVVLAGGLARRMGGGDKPMRALAGRPILAHVVERLVPQCSGLVINANGDPARFATFGLPVAVDSVEGHPGPLAGVLSGLDFAARMRPDIDTVVSVAGDCPFLPLDLVARLGAAQQEEGAMLAVAESGGRVHPVIGLWPVALREDLRRALVEEDLRKVSRWMARYRLATVSWKAEPVDPFFNANTPDDLVEAERLIALLGSESGQPSP